MSYNLYDDRFPGRSGCGCRVLPESGKFGTFHADRIPGPDPDDIAGLANDAGLPVLFLKVRVPKGTFRIFV